MSELVGILNVTPDSFSDGGAHVDAKAAIASALQLYKDGAAIVDIGAESTRPGATPVSPEEEWLRLSPVLRELKNVPFSVDTRHAATAAHALKAGAKWINDVSGFSDPAMVNAVRDFDCKLVVMHSLTVPADAKVVMNAPDAVSEVLDWAKARIASLEVAVIARTRIIFDPGIGFGKTKEQSKELIDRIGEFRALNVPILVGHSRKSFLGKGDNAERDAATFEVSRYLAAQGVDYLRVHNVALHRKML